LKRKFVSYFVDRLKNVDHTDQRSNNTVMIRKKKKKDTRKEKKGQVEIKFQTYIPLKYVLEQCF